MDASKQPPSGEGRGRIEINGLVIPSAWDREGVVTRVVIAAFDETEYELADDEWVKELVPYIHQEVHVVGWAMCERGGRWLLKVEKLRIENNPLGN